MIDSGEEHFCFDDVIRALRPDDLPRCLELSREARWNQNEADWRFLLANCRGYGIELPGQGLVGTTMAWELSGEHSWINMVLVRVSCRGQGLARRLMEACLREVIAAKRQALLDATDLGVKVYQKLGFTGETRVVRLHRASGRGECPSGGEPRLVMRSEDIASIAELDQQVIGVNRAGLLANFQARQPRLAGVLKDAAGRLRGFALGRDGRVATQIGPMVANTMSDACTLLRGALDAVDGPVMIDVPESQVEWMAELQRRAFLPQRSFVRMGRDGATLATDWSRYFAISGPDFA